MRAHALLLAGIVAVLCGLARVADAQPAGQAGREPICIPSTGLVYVGDSSAPPVEFLDDSGQPAGIHIDLLRGLERELHIPIAIRLMSKLEATTAVLRGEAQLTALALADSREREFDFLASTVRSRLSVLLHSRVRLPAGSRDLSGLRIAATRGSYTYEVLSAIKREHRPILVSVDGRSAAGELWRRDQVDGMAGSGAALVWLARSLGERSFVEMPLEAVLMHFVTQKGCGAQLAQVTTAIQTLRERGAIDVARERWAVPEDSGLWRTAGYAGVGALLILAGVLGWNWSLRRQVLERTSALAAAKEAAEAATRAKSEFLAIMSHEIRTPLNAVIATASVLETTGLDADQRELVGVIRQGGVSLLSVISDVLDFSKVEAGRLELDAKAFDVPRLVSEVVALVKRTADDKGLEIEATIDAGVPEWLSGDCHRLRQVLLNLVSNAVKFTERGRVDVRVTGTTLVNDGRFVLRVAVRDTGMGIPPDRIHRLFQPFTQADSSTTRRFGGTGLGLTISRSLVNLMGGEISVETEAGAGSTFSFLIPLPIACAPFLRLQRVPMRVASRLRILMAEDNAINRLVQRRIITHLGHTCDVVGDGRAAIDAAAVTPYDAIILDLQMPVMDGLEAAAGIRRQAHRPWLIVLTADVTPDTRVACQRAGMDDYLTKPITVDGVVVALAKVPLIATVVVA